MPVFRFFHLLLIACLLLGATAQAAGQSVNSAEEAAELEPGLGDASGPSVSIVDAEFSFGLGDRVDVTERGRVTLGARHDCIRVLFILPEGTDVRGFRVTGLPEPVEVIVDHPDLGWALNPADILREFELSPSASTMVARVIRFDRPQSEGETREFSLEYSVRALDGTLFDYEGSRLGSRQDFQVYGHSWHEGSVLEIRTPRSLLIDESNLSMTMEQSRDVLRWIGRPDDLSRGGGEGALESSWLWFTFEPVGSRFWQLSIYCVYWLIPSLFALSFYLALLGGGRLRLWLWLAATLAFFGLLIANQSPFSQAHFVEAHVAPALLPAYHELPGGFSSALPAILVVLSLAIASVHALSLPILIEVKHKIGDRDGPDVDLLLFVRGLEFFVALGLILTIFNFNDGMVLNPFLLICLVLAMSAALAAIAKHAVLVAGSFLRLLLLLTVLLFLGRLAYRLWPVPGLWIARFWWCFFVAVFLLIPLVRGRPIAALSEVARRVQRLAVVSVLTQVIDESIRRHPRAWKAFEVVAGIVTVIAFVVGVVALLTSFG